MSTPNQTDPAQPLAHQAREAFAQHVAAGRPLFEAYRLARGGRIAYDVARQQASRWASRPEVAARVRMLRVEASKAAPVSTPPTPAERPNAATGPLTKQELLEQLSRAVRNGQLDAATLNALLKVHPDLAADSDSQRPDGAMVAAYLAQFGGHKGKAAVEAMGGLRFMVRKVAGALGCTLAELAEACRAAEVSHV